MAIRNRGSRALSGAARFGPPPSSAMSTWSPTTARGSERSFLRERQRVARAPAHGVLDLRSKLGRRPFEEHDQLVVVTDLEDLRCDLHAYRVRLAQRVVDDDAYHAFLLRRAAA